MTELLIFVGAVAFAAFTGTALVSFTDGSMDSSRKYREYGNKHVWPFALLYDLGWKLNTPEKQAARIARNKKRSGF